jgi:sec-independent protein translocase protein TatA
MRFPQGAEWLIILVLILVLFGAKRLPDAARGLGRSLRILKSETKGLHDDPQEAVTAGADDDRANLEQHTDKARPADKTPEPVAESQAPKN